MEETSSHITLYKKESLYFMEKYHTITSSTYFLGKEERKTCNEQGRKFVFNFVTIKGERGG